MATTVAGAGAPERGLTVPESMAASLRNTTWMTDGGASGSSVRSSVSRFVWPYSADCTYQGSCGINSTEYLPGSRLGNARLAANGLLRGRLGRCLQHVSPSGHPVKVNAAIVRAELIGKGKRTSGLVAQLNVCILGARVTADDPRNVVCGNLIQ